jgi:predicted phosphodiesterase
MTTRTAMLSDIHGNSVGLRAVLEDIQDQECTQVFMLGDIINGIDPHGCIRVLRDWCESREVPLSCLKGNGEAYLLTPDREALAGNTADWNLDMLQLTQWWEDHVSANDLEWLGSFHDLIRWNDACLVHDRPADRLFPQSWHNPAIAPKYQEWFFHSPGLEPDMPAADWQALWDLMDAHHFSQVFCGHSHVPFYREYQGRQVCNVGSAGASLDGDPRASWVLVTGAPAAQPDISIRRVAYDVEQFHRLIDQTPDYHGFQVPGYQQAYKQWFATGLHWKAHMPR